MYIYIYIYLFIYLDLCFSVTGPQAIIPFKLLHACGLLQGVHTSHEASLVGNVANKVKHCDPYFIILEKCCN